MTQADSGNHCRQRHAFLPNGHASVPSPAQKQVSKFLYFQLTRPTLGRGAWICPDTSPPSQIRSQKIFLTVQGWGAVGLSELGFPDNSSSTTKAKG